MIRTGQQIITDMMALLRETPLVASVISGKMYRGGLRPRDSQAEDLVVIFTTADAAQFQNGVITLNIYVPDTTIDAGHGAYIKVEDGARCDEIEKAAAQAVEMLTAQKSNYLFHLRNAIHTQREESINQSFVVVRLGFKYFG